MRTRPAVSPPRPTPRRDRVGSESVPEEGGRGSCRASNREKSGSAGASPSRNQTLWNRLSEQRVNERGQRRCRDQEQRGHHQHHESDRDQPPLLVLTEEREELPEEALVARRGR